MLIELAIKNFAIIDDIRISFSKGLSVLTGETGAGKSIIIEAVNLLLGGRVTGDLVRTGEENAELEAFFEIDPESTAGQIMKSQEIDPLEGLMIRRIISCRGRHRLFINSRQSTMHILKRVTENLAGISSQHAHQGFLKQDRHLDILDRFAGTYPLRLQVGKLYDKFCLLEEEILTLKSGIKKTVKDNAFLKFQLSEIEDAGILPNEDKKLEIEKTRLKNSFEIADTVNGAVNEIYLKENSIIEQLGIIKDKFLKYGAIDFVLDKKAERISHTILDLEDLAEELRNYAPTIELDPMVLEKTEARLDLIQKLKRKYGGDLETLFIKYNDLKNQLSDTEEIKKRIDELKKKADQILIRLHEKATVLSDKRKLAGKRLGFLVETELKDLEMDHAGFIVAINSLESLEKQKAESNQEYGFASSELKNQKFINGKENHIKKEKLPCHDHNFKRNQGYSTARIKYSATGIDRVSFLMSPNPGEEPRPLSRIASGGELSRVVLALKAILSHTESLETLIFDEVDAGIGGKVSEKVGIKLKNLASNYQVICITHLAQIAKYGTSHFKITKNIINGRTSTSIAPLTDKQDRIQEIARMIGGEKITDVTMNHAAEMLKTGHTTDEM